MARPCKIPKDPIIYQKTLTAMAYGLSCRLIADWLGENENTVKGWRNRKDFNRDYSARCIDLLIEPLMIMRLDKPDVFIQTHPETRESHAPPKQRNETELKGGINVNLVIDMQDKD